MAVVPVFLLSIPDAVYVAAVSGIVVMAFGVISRILVGAAP